MTASITTSPSNEFSFSDIRPGVSDVLVTATGRLLGVAHRYADGPEWPRRRLQKAAPTGLWGLAVRTHRHDSNRRRRSLNGHPYMRDLTYADLSTFVMGHRLLHLPGGSSHTAPLTTALRFRTRDDGARFLLLNKGVPQAD